MSVQFINIKSELLVDLSTEQQQLLAGGQTNSTNGIFSSGDVPTNPGTTVVVPTMLYSVPLAVPNNIFGNPSSSNSSSNSSSSED